MLGMFPTVYSVSSKSVYSQHLTVEMKARSSSHSYGSVSASTSHCYDYPPNSWKSVCITWKWEWRDVQSSATGLLDPVTLSEHLFTSCSILWRKSCWVLITTFCPIWVNSMFMKLQSKNLRARSWAKTYLRESKQGREGEGEGGVRGGSGGVYTVCLLQFPDLPSCRWLPLFAHSVNYYQKAVYLGCSPTLLHILWPIIKGDLHYKPWSPSKKATATVSASRPIPALQHYLSTPSCFVSPSLTPSHSLSSNPPASTCTC